ncbi:uncharacterized protein LOC117108973 [Anneissia japonica]|uniref:uncharacterized protein LOC117108973 n=1 Tax=Anneissia japonica TaxID=1529436 RepID=UPI001425A5EF|nr:uncharacterized protein LOC117108973 [Anneissia japonica]XP_033107069.1 uncharacterized protein LOC117108973 [Anneissia japonica]XP_033107070.1 uncharacterized protein LOC117108973 [Anneissia japonica]
MSLDIRGRLDVEKVKTGKDMPTEEGRGIGYYDDSMAKLANQEEDERLTEAMDTLNLQKTRMLADSRHELKTVDKTLRKLQNQKKLLRRATLENVISGVNKRIFFKSLQSISEPDSAESDNDDDKDLPKSEPRPPEALIANPYVYPGFPGGSTSTESLSTYDNYWLRRRGINPPLSARPVSTKVFNEAYTNDVKTNGATNKHRKLSRQKTFHNLNNNNESDSTTNPKEGEHIPTRRKVRPKTSTGHNARGRRSSLTSNQSNRNARPHTAKADGHRYRSRRELTQLTHIDAIASADREYRRNEWLEAKSVLKADHDRMLRRKVQSFLEKIERDKTKFDSDANGSVTFLDMKIL